MSLAPTKSRGSFLNWRFAVNGIQKARRSLGAFRRLDILYSPANRWPSPGGGRSVRAFMHAESARVAARFYEPGRPLRARCERAALLRLYIDRPVKLSADQGASRRGRK